MLAFADEVGRGVWSRGRLIIQDAQDGLIRQPKRRSTGWIVNLELNRFGEFADVVIEDGNLESFRGFSVPEIERPKGGEVIEGRVKGGTAMSCAIRR